MPRPVSIDPTDPHFGEDVPGEAPAQSPSAGGLWSGVGEFINKTPFNPKNILDFLMNVKPDDMGRMVEHSYNEGKAALDHFAHAAGDNFGALGLKPDPQGRLAALEKGLTRTVGAIPMAGPPLIDIANQFADGEYAKGVGGSAALASNLLIPEAVAKAPGAAGATGRFIEPYAQRVSQFGRGAEAAAEAKPGLAGQVQQAMPYLRKGARAAAVEGLGTLGGVHGLGALTGAAEVFGPSAIRGAGHAGLAASKALQGLESLGNRISAGNATPLPIVKDLGTVPDAADMGRPQLRPARFSSEVPTTPEGGWGDPSTDLNYQRRIPNNQQLLEGYHGLGETPTEPPGGWNSVTTSPRQTPVPAGPSSAPEALKASFDDYVKQVEAGLDSPRTPTPVSAELPASLQALDDQPTMPSWDDPSWDAMPPTSELYPEVQVPEGFGAVDDAPVSQVQPSMEDVNALIDESIPTLNNIPRSRALQGLEESVSESASAPETAPEIPVAESTAPEVTVPEPPVTEPLATAPTTAPLPGTWPPEMLPKSLEGLEGPDPRLFPRKDHLWGPDTLDKTGAQSQATEFSTLDQKGKQAGNNALLYDPQTPTQYLIDQWEQATDPTVRDYLYRAIKQRGHIEGSIPRSPKKAKVGATSPPETAMDKSPVSIRGLEDPAVPTAETAPDTLKPAATTELNQEALTNIAKAPEGECFNNARKYAQAHESEGAVIVHGKVVTAAGKIIDHAWVEIGDQVHDPTAGITTSKTRYAQEVNAQPESRYTPEHAQVNMIRARHHGPWTDTEAGSRRVSSNDAPASLKALDEPLPESSAPAASKVVRYHVAPANTRNGWFVKTVELDAAGKEVPGRQSWPFPNKREAHAFKEKMNAKKK